MPIFRPYSTESKGLGGLVEAIFGLPLDKRDQMSDWDRRPLTKEQMLYAALDAYVLLEVFAALQDMASKSNVVNNFNELTSQLIRNKNKVSNLLPYQKL